jgi:hypothetical protein
MLYQPQFPPQKPNNRLKALIRRALEARLPEGGRVGEGGEADCHYFANEVSKLVLVSGQGGQRGESGLLEGEEERKGYIPFANSISPAVSSARVASLGRLSRTTEAAIVMGRVASASLTSGSGGAEEGEGGEWEGELGWGEAMVD